MQATSVCFLLWVMVLLHSASALGLQQPRTLLTDHRVKQVSYQPNNVVRLNGTLFIATQIIFADNERVISVQGGDSSAWNIDVDKDLANVMTIKPTLADTKTNLHVITESSTAKRHYYHFALQAQAAVPANPKNVTYVLRFIYPPMHANLVSRTSHPHWLAMLQLAKHRHLAVQLNWDYSFSGDKRVMPLHVFDDGQFTYLQLRSQQKLPAVFVVDNAAGQEAMVNIQRVGDYLIIHQVATQLTLRYARNQVACIFNNPRIARL